MTEGRAENPSRALALVLVDELVRAGLADACLAPGSRSAPLALALAQHPAVRLHVVIDERSAAFVALGLAKATGRPAVVVSTSGTAAANFHPAVVEADYSRTPLLVLTADRPPELRQTGANQTIDQLKIYGGAVRWFAEAGVAEQRTGSVPYWRSLAARAWATACAPHPGPVHLNLSFRDPLVPLPDGEGFPEDLSGRPAGRPWTEVRPAARPLAEEDLELLAAEIAAADRGLVVAGDCRVDAAPVLALAQAAGWPLVAEAVSGVRSGPNALSTYDALLRHPGFSAAHRPDLVIRIGRTASSRALGALLGPDVRQVLLDPGPEWPDPERTISLVVGADPAAACADLAKVVGRRERSAWLASWLDAERRAREALDRVLDQQEQPTEPRTARDLAAALPSGATLVVASSMPVRDLDWFMRPRVGLRILGNRGASGIDGFVSTTLGAALAGPGPTVALAGDLAMLHDQNGLLLARTEPVAAVFVVVNNDGGGIFSFLPQAAFPEHFEQVFGTPHGVDFAALAALHGCRFVRVERAADLVPIVSAATGEGGVHIVEVRTEREANVAHHQQLWEAVAAAIEQS
jgi:2-succinyl-5-enolpyruvyl-6-hydroxy-3-cyclohexene-1-carboxylate synthase